jgi:hypothetical protein
MLSTRAAVCGLITGLLAIAAPSAASAIGTTSIVSGTIGSELSLSVAPPVAMVLTHGEAGASSSAVKVVSTDPSWTLSVADHNTGANAGHMIKLAGSKVLDDPLEWSVNDTSFSTLSGSPATVASGSLVGSKTVYFRQALSPEDEVAEGESYSLTVAYTVA